MEESLGGWPGGVLRIKGFGGWRKLDFDCGEWLGWGKGDESG